MTYSETTQAHMTHECSHMNAGSHVCNQAHITSPASGKYVTHASAFSHKTLSFVETLTDFSLFFLFVSLFVVHTAS